MAKKNGGKVIQMLSPENYIRKKARTLPIYECMVNDEWEDSRMVQLSVARQHTNGNVTVCFYLVDLLCLGVKDTHYMFNISMTEYREQIDDVNTEMPLSLVNYELVHNIVFAGLEFADDYGFKPHKDFTSITRFMLEEDTDDVELIEIECGMKGNPAFMRGPFDDDAKVKRIIAQLEKTAGPGNYTVMDGDEDFMDDELIDEFYDEFGDEFYDDKFDEMPFDEKKEMFLDLSSRLEDLDEEEQEDIGRLVNSLIDELIDVDLHNTYFDEFHEALKIETRDDRVDDQVLGIKTGEPPVSEELKSRFLHIYQLIGNNHKQAEKELDIFEKESRGLPAVYFLELLHLQAQESRKFSKRIKQYAFQYPDYPLMRLLWATEQILSGTNIQEAEGYPFASETFFPGRGTIHPLEYHYFLTLHLFLAASENDLTKTEAFASVLGELDLPEDEYEVFGAMISMIKIGQLLTHLTQ